MCQLVECLHIQNPDSGKSAMHDRCLHARPNPQPQTLESTSSLLWQIGLASQILIGQLWESILFIEKFQLAT